MLDNRIKEKHKNKKNKINQACRSPSLGRGKEEGQSF